MADERFSRERASFNGCEPHGKPWPCAECEEGKSVAEPVPVDTQLAEAIERSRRSLDLIGEGDWTPQDARHLMLADAATTLLVSRSAEPAEDTRGCPNCQGFGRVRSSMSPHSVPCGRCDGRGTIPDSASRGKEPGGAMRYPCFCNCGNPMCKTRCQRAAFDNVRFEEPEPEGQQDDDRKPCTCTLACIPASISEEQFCREERSARG